MDNFWGQTVLQLSHDYPFVMDCIVVLSTLYEHPQYLKTFQRGTPLGPPPLDKYHAQALTRFNRALFNFKLTVENGKATPSLALLSCLLFTCIEMIRDHVFSAALLISQASDMIKQYHGMSLTGHEQILFQTIERTFARLGVLANGFGHPYSAILPLEFTREYAEFSSLSEARSALYGLMSRGYELFRDAEQHKLESYVGVDTWHSGKMKNSSEFELNSNEANISPTSSTLAPKVGGERDKEEEQHMNDSDDGEAEGYPDLFRPTYLKAFSGIIRYKCKCDVLDCSCDTEQNMLNPEAVGGRGSPNDKEDSDYLSFTVGHTGLTGLLQFKCGCGDDQACNCHGDPSTALSTKLEQRQQTTSQQSDKFHPSQAELDLRMRQQELETQLRQWYDVFQESIPTMYDMKVEASSSLLMYYHVTYIWVVTCLARWQMSYDECEDHFSEVLRHAEIFFDNARDLHNVAFTFEVATIPPLYSVVTKCRVPTLRRKALQLMSLSPRKESIWGANTTAQVAACIIGIEEEGLGLPRTNWDGSSCDPSIPVIDTNLPDESKRIHNLELLKNRHSGAFEIRTTRYREIDGKLWRVVDDNPI